MKVLGIELRRPTFNEVTSASVLAVGLWVALIGLARAAGFDLTPMDAGAALLVLGWSCVAVQIGIHVGRGHRHLAANVVISAMLLGAYQSAWAFAG